MYAFNADARYTGWLAWGPNAIASSRSAAPAASSRRFSPARAMANI